jgi:hypothetical protein
MLDGLMGFASGRLQRASEVGAADLALRRLAAIDALSRYRENLSPRLLDAITVEPDLWPTSSLLDWIDLLTRMETVPDRDARLVEARRILRSRLILQGTLLGFSSERRDGLWWLMVSPDTNASRTLIAMLEDPDAQPDLARVARGVLARQRRGHWDTTPANAWGVVAMDRFTARRERDAVTGSATVTLATETKRVDWSTAPEGATLSFSWPRTSSEMTVTQSGGGEPWVTVLSRAAVPLSGPMASGFRVARTVTPIDQRSAGVWSRGDIARVRLDVEGDQDMSWVVVSDPIPAGATLLGGGLGGDVRAVSAKADRTGPWAAFEERTFEAFRAYFPFVSAGRWSVEYMVRLNGVGRFALPPTRVEALYAPEVFGALPNSPIEVVP